MRIRFWNAALAALALTVMSCTDGPTAPASHGGAPSLSVLAAALPPVRIAEIHYDNAGTDAGEAIEISGPAGTSVAGWSVVLYNGSSTVRAPYNTRALTGEIPATCGARGVIVLEYPANGIQNGGTSTTGTTDPDGVALVNAAGEVVEFLSWEGSFTAASGAAAGLVSADIGVRELGTTAEGDNTSLKRDGAGAWTASAPRSFGSCNDGDGPPPPPVAAVTVTPATASLTTGGTLQLAAEALDAQGAPVAGTAFTWSTLDAGVASVTDGLVTALTAGTARIVAAAPNGTADTATVTVTDPVTVLPAIRFSEIHYDNANVDANEAVEIEGPAGASVNGWRVVLYNGNGGVAYDTRVLEGTIPATCGTRGVITLNYPTDGIQNGAPDGVALVDAEGTVIEFLSYEGTLTATDGAAAGASSIDIGVAESSASSAAQSLQRNDAGTWLAPDVSTFGRCNRDGPPPPASTVTITGRGSSDPALPVGFEDQLFATLRSPTGVFIPTSFTWSSDTPDLATVDARGFATARGAGDAVIRATAADGTTGTFRLRTQAATRSATAEYQSHVEFGVPADGDASNDFLLEYGTYTASYDGTRGISNWVSYNLEPSHFGPQDRCECFTFDQSLPASFTRYKTADYSNAAAFHGYGIDRGHLVRSADRGAGVYDNASTFYLTNIIPQASDNNQGPWARLEDTLASVAASGGKEVWVIAGATGSKGTVKNEGLVTIPTHTWKVAVIAPRNSGLANVDDLADVEIIAAIIPNEPGIRSVPWRSYETTVDAVEALSGYDLLALLPDHIEIALESETMPPVAAVDGPWAALEGSAIGLSAAASSDPDGQALTFAWSFGDGSTGSGASPSHTWAQDGAYTVRVIVTDPLGLADTAEATVTVANVAPAIAAFAGATLLPGEAYAAQGSASDPGADALSATVDYGDGSGEQPLALDGGAFSLAHSYASAGSITVTVRVRDDDVTTTRTTTVTVLSAAQAARGAIGLVEQLAASGALSSGVANSLVAKLSAAERAFDRDGATAALGQLGAALNELDALTRTGRTIAADTSALRSLIERIVTSVS
jgi:DNA/RNA endonuclease G (NUC1)/PKD repeat protein